MTWVTVLVLAGTDVFSTRVPPRRLWPQGGEVPLEAHLLVSGARPTVSVVDEGGAAVPFEVTQLAQQLLNRPGSWEVVVHAPHDGLAWTLQTDPGGPAHPFVARAAWRAPPDVAPELEVTLASMLLLFAPEVHWRGADESGAPHVLETTSLLKTETAFLWPGEVGHPELGFPPPRFELPPRREVSLRAWRADGRHGATATTHYAAPWSWHTSPWPLALLQWFRAHGLTLLALLAAVGAWRWWRARRVA